MQIKILRQPLQFITFSANYKGNLRLARTFSKTT